MEFNKAYNRNELVKFLRTNFLPEDFIQEETPLANPKQFQYTQQVTRLGECKSLELVVFEVLHSSVSDARVGLTKEAFRMLADEFCERALVFFVPQDDNSNYRFSLIEITLEQREGSAKIQRTYSNPHRYSYYLGEGISYHTPNKYLNEAGRVVSIEDLRSRFSVEVLTKAFYQELSDWYAWAVKKVHFPNVIDDDNDNESYNSEAMIRLITRLIFVWFIKQRHLVPDEFFDERYISDHLLKSFTPNAETTLFGKADNSYYYKGILQNLFFAMLNSPITPEGKDTISERRFRKDRADYDNNKLMRHKDLFQDPQLFVDLANKYVPFLNGGLFDCLDDKDNGKYFDAFTDREEIAKQLVVPDYLFFGEDVGRNIDLSEWYGDKRKKKVSARGIIDILKRYNFTVEENTPFDQDVSLDPELLGKVFENLLASYNPETQTTARKQTGSFYTPREIVQYMVDESLVAHLKRTVGDDLEAEYRKLIQYTDEKLSLTDEQRKAILQSIYQCKVLDPACGSGAFPMGMLQQMVHILNRIDPDNKEWKEMMVRNAISETSEAYLNATDEERKEMVSDIERSFNENVNRPDYARKLYLIENCIYGVDIQPIAIQISKLRFFISLVVDQKTNNSPVDNFGIRPLPNLEAKFVAANTLIGIDKKDANLFTSDKVLQKETEMKETKHRIFCAKTVKTKRKHKERIATLKKELAVMLEGIGAVGNEEATLLASWDMFDQNATSSFFDPEWMFAINDGFDIVIGNPPYVQLQSNGGNLGKLYRDCGYSTFTNTGDLYCLMYERGYQLLCQGGFLCYITSNTWMRASYGEKLRILLATKMDPLIVLDFAGLKVFESATVDTNIILLGKSVNRHQTICVATGKANADSVRNLSLFVQQQGTVCEFRDGKSWVILSPIEQSIKRKIEVAGTPLKDWNINICRGVLTGCNDAFIITSEKRDEILFNCKDEDERVRTDALIRPILRGRDIKRYQFDWAGLYLIATFPSKHYDIIDYQSVKHYLLSYGNGHGQELLEQTGATHIIDGKPIKSRKKTKNKWFETQDSISYWEDLSQPKILWGEISDKSKFAFDFSGNYFPEATSFYMQGEYIEFLLCALNSKVSEWFFSKVGTTTGVGTIRWKKYTIERLVVAKPSKECLNEYVKTFEKLKNKQISNLEFEQHCNDIMCQLYGLTPEEIDYINNS